VLKEAYVKYLFFCYTIRVYSLSELIKNNMNVKNLAKKIEGQKVPKVILKINKFDGKILPGICPIIDWEDIKTDEFFKGKKVVLFALPGAYTPTCSSKQLPGYEKSFSEFKKLGVDLVICLAVNDPFVMKAWADVEKIKNVMMLPDGNGDFSRKLGTLVKKNNLGFGERSWRYSMYVIDGKIQKIFLEEGITDNFQADPYLVSDEKTMLEYLKSSK
jgi:thioredoxin-dependent peroxiredoxin